VLKFIINQDTCFRLSPFSDIKISQGSILTLLRSVGLLVSGLLQITDLNHSVKNSENLLMFSKL